MAGAINRFPQGLLALLDLKTRGENPNQLGNTVQAGVDLLPFYELGQGWRWSSNAALGVALNAVAPVLVPNDEVWLIRLAFIKVTAVAAGSWSGHLSGGPVSSLANILPLTSAGIGLGTGSFTPSATGQTFVQIFEPKMPMLVGPGWGFYSFTDTAAGGGFTCQTGVLHSRYQN